jgi:hypothetical protein
MGASNTFAQGGESPLKIFGYFQTSFQHWTTSEDRPEGNSFSLQQLNLFFQKDLARNWSAFVNFEFLNNFSSSRQWGAANLEEAWVKYRLNEKFNLKLGLQIPIFNNLNAVKNRTPVLPYIIRPLVYETSFSEFIAIEEFVPARAFGQVYGFFPSGEAKFEYAFYIGNSANINNHRERGQTGIDTTATLLAGGRLGIRYRELKLGLSATYEKRNEFIGFAEILGRQPSELQELPAIRLGGDLSYNLANFSLESEFITVNVDEGIPELKLDLDFYYATLGYYFTDKLFAYGSYWVTKAYFAVLATENGKIEDEEILVPNAGISYNLNDRIRLKGQYARVTSDDVYARVTSDDVLHLISEDRIEIKKDKEKFGVYAIAVSVFF